MAYNIWRGDAQAIAQIALLTVGGTPTATDTVSVTINRKVYTYTVQGGDTTATVAAALYALVAASTFAEFQEVNWTYTAGNAFFNGTANTPGIPFTVTASATGATTLTATTPTASTGPYQYDEPKNWSLGTVPTGSDSTLIDAGSDLRYGGGSISGLTIEIRNAFDGNAGLAERNTLGYYEYRTRYITLNSTTVKIGEGDGQGSSQLFVQAIASSTWTIYNTSQRATQATPALDIDMTGNPTLITVSGGDVGLCFFDESTARTVPTLNVTTETSRVTIGRNVTVTALNLNNGQIDTYGTSTTVVMGKGTYNQLDGTLTTFTSYGGYVRLAHAGTVTTATFRGQGGQTGTSPPVCDCTQNNLARVFTNSEFTGGAGLLDPNKTVTFTNPYLTDGASYAASDIGPRFSVQRS